jgi:signal transduction histidine kinase
VSIWETAADPLRKTLLVLALGSGGAVLVRLFWMLERRRQRLEKYRLEHTRRAQQRQRQSEEQRLQIERKLSSSLTAAVVAHEIQQPLSTILLHCRLALEELERADAVAAGRSSLPGRASASLQAQLAERLAALNSEAQRAVQITERMRMLLRNVNTPHSPVNLPAVVESALLFFRRAIRQHAIALTTTGLEEELWLEGDATQLQSAINNLLQNAIDALLLHSPNDRRLHLALIREASRVRLRIADSGPGFADHTPAIPLSTSKPQGSGLGLFVVRTTMQNHGGQLTLGRSAQLGGAEVELTWPLPASASAAGGEVEPAGQDAQGAEGHHR